MAKIYRVAQKSLYILKIKLLFSINIFLFLFSELKNKIPGNFWHGTAQTARATMQLLTAMFQDRVISLKSDFEWSPCSSDLAAPDF